YQQDDGALVADANGVDGELMDCGGCTQVRSSGNVSMASFDPFVSAGGADGNLDTPDGDFTLATTDVAITEGGVDTASTSCGNTGQLHDCGALTVDFAGRARTLPTSIGAHEKD
ncbi:MAG TPA: hypothetical protein VLC93_16110, partial [Myxococcota bacterium]|nr:hypothetical protein [Myxococcota bacterium]